MHVFFEEMWARWSFFPLFCLGMSIYEIFCINNHVICKQKQFCFFLPNLYIFYFLFLCYCTSYSCIVYFFLNIFNSHVFILIIGYCLWTIWFNSIWFDLMCLVWLNGFIKLLLHFSNWVSITVVNQHLWGWVMCQENYKLKFSHSCKTGPKDSWRGIFVKEIQFYEKHFILYRDK